MSTMFLAIVCPVVIACCLFVLARQRDWLVFWLVIGIVCMFAGIALFNLHEAEGLRRAQGLYR
jgi:hypothetical protein